MPDISVTVAATTAAWITAASSISTFLLGFFVSRFTMTKKERADVDRDKFQNTKELLERQEQTFQDYASAIRGYIDCEDKEGLDHFYDIATNGEKYFYQLKIACDAILSNRVDITARDNTLVPKIREAVDKTLSDHYKTLSDIAKKKKFRYEGCLKRENYTSLFAVVEKYGVRTKWQ